MSVTFMRFWVVAMAAFCALVLWTQESGSPKGLAASVTLVVIGVGDWVRTEIIAELRKRDSDAR